LKVLGRAGRPVRGSGFSGSRRSGFSRETGRLTLAIQENAMKWFLGFLLFAAVTAGWPQASMEIIPLKHRTLEQVIPVIEPLVEQGGSVSGMNNRLIVRTSPANLEEIKRVLAAIDTPPRRLMISVTHDNALAGERIGAEVSGSIGGGGVRATVPGTRAPGGAGVEIRSGDDVARAKVYSSRGRAEDRIAQQVQTIEGGRAFIQIGYSFPLPLRQVVIGPYGAVVSNSVVYRDLGTGFYAAPTLAGERVTIEISPQQEALSTTVRGAVHSSRISTTVSGRLGEWIELGRTTGDTQSQGTGTLSYSTRGTQEQRRVLLRVDELR
jgi:hypothetical protein